MSEYWMDRPLERYEFQARWIAPAGCETQPAVYFRAVKNFELSKLPERAELRISADTVYRVWLNGVEVGHGPVRGTMQLQYYDLYEVAALLRSGRNTLAVLVFSQNEDNFIADTVQPALLAELDGCGIRTDGNWLVAPAPEWRSDVDYFTAQIGRAEWRDFRLEPANWRNGDGVSRWAAAKVIAADSPLYAKQLVPCDVPQLRETVYGPVDIAAVALVPELKDPDDIHIAALATTEEQRPAPPELTAAATALLLGGATASWVLPVPKDRAGITFIADFRREITGRLEVEISAPAGTIVDITYEEELTAGRLRAEHDCYQKVYHFTDRYILDGNRRCLGTTLSERGFRMVAVTIRRMTGPVTVHALRAIDRRYPVTARGQFFSSDPMLNCIWQISCETLSTCMLDVFIDCPWRERAFWVNDLIVENLTSLQAFGASAIHRRAFRLAFGQHSAEGLLPGVCPAPVHHHPGSPWPNTAMVLPATNLYIGRMLLDYWRYSGDGATVKCYLPEYERILEIFAAWVDADGILAVPAEFWNFVDWGYELTGVSLSGRKSAALQAFYVMALQDWRTLATELGCEAETEVWRRREAAACEALVRVFYDPRRGRLADWLEADGSRSHHASQLAHALAWLVGAVTPENAAHCLDALDDAALLMPEFYMHLFVLEAFRRSDLKFEALTRIRNLWGRNVLTGTPVWWEAGVHQFGKEAHGRDGSLCHGFAAAPVDFLQRGILGIEPLTAGFATFLCNPYLGDLRFVRGLVPTPFGNIEVAAERQNDGLHLTLRVPARTEAHLIDGRVLAAGVHRVVVPLYPAQ